MYPIDISQHSNKIKTKNFYRIIMLVDYSKVYFNMYGMSWHTFIAVGLYENEFFNYQLILNPQ